MKSWWVEKIIEGSYCLLKLLLYFVCLEQLMKSITIQIIHYSGCKINFFVFRIVVQSVISTPARQLQLSSPSEFADM